MSHCVKKDGYLKKKESKVPVSQLVNVEVNSGNRKAVHVLASNYMTCGPERYKTLFALCLDVPGLEI